MDRQLTLNAMRTQTMGKKQHGAALVACPLCPAAVRPDHLARHIEHHKRSATKEENPRLGRLHAKTIVFYHKSFPFLHAAAAANQVKGSLAKLHYTASEFHHAIMCRGQPEADCLLARIVAGAKELANGPGSQMAAVAPTSKTEAIKKQDNGEGRKKSSTKKMKSGSVWTVGSGRCRKPGSHRS